MTAAELQAGRLEQACPDCGTWEAAGGYCTKCRRPMGPDDWYRNGDETRRAVAHERAAEIEQTRVKRGRGRPGGASVRLPADGTLFGLTSPLRQPSEEPTPVPSSPLSGPGQLGSSLGWRRGRQPVEDTGS